MGLDLAGAFGNGFAFARGVELLLDDWRRKSLLVLLTLSLKVAVIEA